MSGCDHQEWEHWLFDGQCPPSLPPRSCCGASGDDPKNDLERLCVNRQCVEWFCSCGVFLQMSAGPTFCGCDDLPGWGRLYVDQRPKRAIPAGRTHHRKYLARKGKRR